MNKWIAIAGCASALLLAACASGPVTMDSASLLKPGYGVVAASFQFTVYGSYGDRHQHRVEMPYMRADIHPAGGSGGDTAVLATSSLATSSHWGKDGAALATNAGDRVMDVALLKPGRYKIKLLETSFNFAKRKSIQPPSQDIVFDVKEGQVTYIGSIQAMATMGFDMQGATVPKSIAVSVRDEFDDDAPAMRAVDRGMGTLVLRDGLRP